MANTVVATAAFVTEIDDIQYGMDQGPASVLLVRGGPSCQAHFAETHGGRGSAAGSPGSACTAWCRCR